MVDHHDTVEAARNAVEPFLREWELFAALHQGFGLLSFVYEGAEVLDRSAAGGGKRLFAQAGSYALVGGNATLRVGRASYPEPPVGVSRDPDVDAMFARYCLFREARTTLSDAAYYCLTVLQRAAGGRRADACSAFSIDRAVLDKIGSLSSEKGGYEARKADGSAAEFLPEERAWLEAAIPVLIERAARRAFDRAAPNPKMTMADLPPLPLP